MAKDDTIDVDDVYRRLREEGQSWMENSPQRRLMNDARAAIRKLKKAARRPPHPSRKGEPDHG